MKTIIVTDTEMPEADADCNEYPHQYIFINRGIERMKIVYHSPGNNLRDFTIYELPSGREVNQETIEWSHIYHLFYADMDERKAFKEYVKVLRLGKQNLPWN